MPRGINSYDEYSLQGILDPDVKTYLSTIERIENQSLENNVKMAIHDFVVGCKVDEIWNSIKACCILAGARTLSGSLVPLKGTAPTNFNFVSGDYNRKTGLLGDGSTKYLNANRNNNVEPQNNRHAATYLTSAPSQTSIYIGTTVATTPGSSQLASSLTGNTGNFSLSNTSVATVAGQHLTLGFRGATRTTGATITARVNATDTSLSLTSNSPVSSPTYIYCRDGNAVFSNARLAFYSIGEALNLALLDARVTQLINTLNTAIV